MLTEARLEQILSRIPRLTLGVVGDLFLDRYLDIDASLTEPSLETGLDAYQVVRVRPAPGAAGTVLNNLAALGVGRIHVISVIGDDGEGYELRRALHELGCVDDRAMISLRDRRTPTYTKPMFQAASRPPRELNRLDIKNRIPLLPAIEDALLGSLDEAWNHVDGLLVVDQVGEENCGVVTARIRERLASLGKATPSKLILADSRRRIGLFQSVCLKPNVTECVDAIRNIGGMGADVESCAAELARRARRPVFCTCGEKGMLVVDPRSASPAAVLVPAYAVAGPIDTVGAGDSTSAGIACAIAAGASPEEAAAFGNLVASITIQQIGTTGTATPEKVRRRRREVCHS